MLPLAKVAKLSTREVLWMLTQLPNSRYLNSDMEMMGRAISQHEARRYLVILTILNDAEKSNLSEVKEDSRDCRGASLELNASIDGQVQFVSRQPCGPKETAKDLDHIFPKIDRNRLAKLDRPN